MYSTEVSKLIAEGSRAYSAKNYELASEKYGESCLVYNEENGADDADLLLLYGKALFQNAVLRSDVFGGKSDIGEKKEAAESDEEDSDEEGNFGFHDAENVEEQAEEEEEEEEQGEFEGEVEGEVKEEAGEGNEDEEVEQTDFEVAWEILDLTRALFESKIQLVESQKSELSPPYLESETTETTNEFIILTKKLSETLDLLGEVSLEAENFAQSAIDLQSSLDLRLLLFSSKSSLISESHYKLSLALEFCVEDPKSRSKAAEQMKLAIESVKGRTKDETDPEKIKDNKELIQDLLVRYNELEKDPIEELEPELLDLLKGLLGQASTATDLTDLASIIKPVNDLSTSVKKRPVNDLTGAVKRRKGSGGKKQK